MNTFRLFNKHKTFNRKKHFSTKSFRRADGTIDKPLVFASIYGCGAALTTIFFGVMVPLTQDNNDAFDVIEHSALGLILGSICGCIWPYFWPRIIYNSYH